MKLQVKISAENTPLVLVDWYDAMRGGGWEPLTGLTEKQLECQAVGWLVRASDRAVTIVSTINEMEGETDSCNGYLVIPRGCVIKIQELDTMKELKV